MTFKKILILSIIISFAVGFNFMNSAISKPSKKKFHTEAELSILKDSLLRAPIVDGEYFLPSSNCRGCHGYDSAHVANINESGDDVNLVSRWESSMMALSAKDPLWRAKVSQEIITNPAHAGVLQNKCTSCHAPMGRYTSMYHGNAYYGISNLENDPLGLDGVACGTCHTIAPSVGYTFSGNIPFDTLTHVEYGPFTAPFIGPMQLYEGFTPVYSPHMDHAKVCSSCHTLVTETADLNGNLTGGYFVEQATYHEFLNSSFPANNYKCQTCHMPQLTDGITIANGFLGLTARSPFNQHVFAGANSFMLKLIKNNHDSLNVTVAGNRFDSTITATINMLRLKSIALSLSNDSIGVDTAYFKVKIQNKAGHKFPSGYPARRAVVQFLAIDAINDTIFRSGMFAPDYRVLGETPAYEPHHNIINQSGVTQIYEMAMGDVNSNFTSVLERAAVVLKDNRIPPTGFTSSSSVYDTCVISSDATNDSDFNKLNSTEGTGSDYIHYNVPLAGAIGSLSIKVSVYYQSVPPKWLDEMFTLNSQPINIFRTMYQNADQSPVLIASDSLNNINLSVGMIKLSNNSDIKVFPSITMNGNIFISSEYGTSINSIEVYDEVGKLVFSLINTNYQTSFEISLPPTRGIYYLRLPTNNKVWYKKIVRL